MGARILLADNDSGYRRSLGDFLRLDGYEVVEAASPEEALGRLDKNAFDLALVDLRLTNDRDDVDMSGLKVVVAFTQRGIPVVIITAFPSVEATRSALRGRGGGSSTAVDFVPKVDGPWSILDAITAVLGKAEQNP